VLPYHIHPETRPGTVHLNVADLERQVAFYQDILKFRLHWQEDGTAGLGSGGVDLLRLTEIPGAPRYRGVTGLYHFAVLFPDRHGLAQAVARLFSLRYRNYPTDHIMTKTTYLDDPEGNGIELYADSPEDGVFSLENGVLTARRADGTPSDGREPLDVEGLLGELAPGENLDEPIPAQTKIGHVHVHVANLDEAMHFYRDVLGFDDKGLARAFQMGMVSAGGYHHHIGFNTWAGEGVPPPPQDARGLRHFSIVLPDAAALEGLIEQVERSGLPIEQTGEGILIRDPSQNGILLISPSA
jgi:catechol 2,3-dioxygenase